MKLPNQSEPILRDINSEIVEENTMSISILRKVRRPRSKTRKIIINPCMKTCRTECTRKCKK